MNAKESFDLDQSKHEVQLEGGAFTNFVLRTVENGTSLEPDRGCNFQHEKNCTQGSTTRSWLVSGDCAGSVAPKVFDDWKLATVVGHCHVFFF